MALVERIGAATPSRRGAPVAVERALLAGCLRLGQPPGDRLRELICSAPRWRRVLALARGHAVSEAVFHALAAAGQLEAVPPAVRQALREDHENACARNALLLSDAVRVQALLLAHGVETVALKGAALVAAHYPHPGARHVADLDLLARSRDLGRLRQALREAGWRPRQRGFPDYDGWAVAAAGLSPVEPGVYLRLPGGTYCEVHTDLPGLEGRLDLTERVFERARTIDVPGGGLRVPSTPDLALMLCTHVAIHHRDDWRFRARHVVDLSCLLAGAPTALSEARHGAGATAAAAIGLSEELFRAGDTGLASGAGATLLASPPLPTRVDVGLRLAWRLWRRWRGRSGSPGRILFPRPQFMAVRYGIPRSHPAFPLLYLWRPLCAVARVFGARW